jgi:hypothetical protein
VYSDLFTVPFFVTVLYGNGYLHKLVLPSGKIGITANVTVRVRIVFIIRLSDLV